MDTIIWIPSHVGILGNEAADHLAKMAITEGKWTTKCIPHSDYFSLPKQDYITKSTKFLKIQGKNKGFNYFQSFNKLAKSPWFKKFNLKKENLVSCIRMKTNHYALNHSLFKFNLVPNPSCDCGYPQQDLDHVFWSCQNYVKERDKLIKALIKFIKNKPPFMIQNLLRKPSKNIISAICNFLEETNLKV